MNLKIRESKIATITTKPGTRVTSQDVVTAVKAQTGKTVDKSIADDTAINVTKSGKASVIVEKLVVKDSTGEDLAIGDVVEVKGKKFTIRENENGVCLATMEGTCVMDVTDPKARSIFKNSKRVVDESYEPTSPEEPILSLGHIDDEPGMLKQTVYEIIENGKSIYEMLDYYESLNVHVDLPNWLQSKIILGRDYIAKAADYLEYESRKHSDLN